MKRPIAYFAGTGRGVPSTVFTNAEFATIGIETTDEWIVERTGIKQRHIAKTETATDLAAKAARCAMEKAGVGPGELDIIVLGTASPKYQPVCVPRRCSSSPLFWVKKEKPPSMKSARSKPSSLPNPAR